MILKLSRDPQDTMRHGDIVTVAGHKFVFGEKVDIGTSPVETASNLFRAMMETLPFKVSFDQDERWSYISVELVSEALTPAGNVWVGK